MYILGDIGNSETKIFLVNSNDRIIRQVNFIRRCGTRRDAKKDCERNNSSP